MPYIDEETKAAIVSGNIGEEFNPLPELCMALQLLPDDKRDGAVNYVISTIVASSMRPDDGWRYNSLLRAYGTFLAAAAEFYRRLVAPYEDKAIAKNGDIPEYAE